MPKPFAALKTTFLLFILFFVTAFASQAQTTVFTYQGRLSDSTDAQLTHFAPKISKCSNN